jgi:hypothetical protein
MRFHHLGLLLLLVVATVAAKDEVADSLPPDPSLNPDLLEAGILQNYPDLMFRQWGMRALNEKNHDRAWAYFRRASYYADKPSQGMVAEMLWEGRGVPQDRAMAYVWMDLAAERGYPLFVASREMYWAELTEDERERALIEGQQVYARFGDEAAKVRYANQLRWKQKAATGSHLGGFAGTAVRIGKPGIDEDDSDAGFDASKFYDPQNFDADKYWQRTDRVWSRLRNPRVTVGELEQAGQTGEDQVRSRVPQTRPEIDSPEPEIPEVP